MIGSVATGADSVIRLGPDGGPDAPAEPLVTASFRAERTPELLGAGVSAVRLSAVRLSALAGFGVARRVDEAAQVGHRVKQILLTKLADRLTDGVTGDAELLDEPNFRKEVFWRVFRGVDIVPDLLR
ncbi:hypothetical protein GCM10009734_50760 [Nonomuraea bangladeshensis]